MGKTKPYTKKAVKKYLSGFDMITFRLPKGTKERIEKLGLSPDDRVQIFLDGLERLEKEKEKQN